MTTASTKAAQKSPDAFRTISEVSEELDLPQHVLRFWETRFAQVKPMKRGGGRRLYRPDHVALLRGIKALLYDDGLTIKGVQKMLREKGAKTVISRGKADSELSLERVDHSTEVEGMLPLDLPENAAEQLESLRSRAVPAAAAAAAASEDHERIKRSIDKLESVLSRLESDQEKA